MRIKRRKKNGAMRAWKKRKKERGGRKSSNEQERRYETECSFKKKIMEHGEPKLEQHES